MDRLRVNKVLDTPTPQGSSNSGLQTIGRMKPSSRLPGIALDDAERKRRTIEKRVTHDLDAIASSDDDDDGYDAQSPRYGDGKRRAGDMDDDLSIQIPLRQQQPAREHTDDLSSISFDRTLSPRHESPQRHSMARTHDSPVSHFDSMARNLRGALDDVLQSGYGQSGVSLPKAVSPHAHHSRRVFGSEVSNTVKTSSPPPRSYALPAAPILSPSPRRTRTAYAAVSTPARPREHRMPDVTGLTEGLMSPEKVRGHRAPPPERPQQPARDVPFASNLAHLQHKLERLEDVNDRSTQRIHQLEDAIGQNEPRLQRRSPDHDSGFGSGGSNFGETKQGRHDLDSIVQRLRSHVYRLGQSLTIQAEAIADLRGRRGTSNEDFETLRRRVDVLETEVDEIRKLTETVTREEALKKVHQRERARQDSEPSRSPRLSERRPYQPRESELDRELRRAEAILSSVPRDHSGYTCSICRRREVPSPAASVPPQTVLARVLRDLEDDFSSSKVIFTELTEAYKKMDPASDAVRRRTLAKHLKDSVDVLEQKADQIKAYWDLLHTDPLPAAVHQFRKAGHSA